MKDFVLRLLEFMAIPFTDWNNVIVFVPLMAVFFVLAFGLFGMMLRFGGKS